MSGMNNASSTLESLRTFQTGWDGRQSPPPSTEALQSAEELVSTAKTSGLGNYVAIADVGGGIVLFILGGKMNSSGTWDFQIRATILPNGNTGGMRVTGDVPQRTEKRWNEAVTKRMTCRMSEIFDQGRKG